MTDRYEHGDDHGFPSAPPTYTIRQPGAVLVRLIEGSVNVELPFRYIKRDMTFELHERVYKALIDCVADSNGATMYVNVHRISP